MAGPNQRAGFIAAPVNAVPMNMPAVTVKPIARPAILPNDPSGSIAVANITHTRKNVRMASIRTPCPVDICVATAGVPRFTTLGPPDTL